MKNHCCYEYKLKNKANMHSTILIAGDDERLTYRIGANLQRTRFQIHYALNHGSATKW